MSEKVRLRAGSFEADGKTLSARSMAREIDDALAALIPVRPNEDPYARRVLALAIAQGVIKHLHDNSDAFVYKVPGFGGAIERYVRVDTE